MQKKPLRIWFLYITKFEGAFFALPLVGAKN